MRELVEPAAQLGDPIAGGGGARDDRARAAESFLSLSVPGKRVDQVGLEAEVELAGRDEVGRALQEACCAGEVEPAQGAAARSGETLSSFRGERAVCALSELRAVAHGLFEVEAEQLVALYRRHIVLEPARERLVQVRSAAFRQRLVGSVADQEMTEAEAVLARSLGRLGRDQLLPHQAGKLRCDLRLVADERLDCAAMKDLAFDRGALEHG